MKKIIYILATGISFGLQFTNAQTTATKINAPIDLLVCNNNTNMFLTQQYVHDACPKGVKPILYVQNFATADVASIYIKPDSLIDLSSARDSREKLTSSLEKPFTCLNGMTIYKHNSLNFLNSALSNDTYCTVVQGIKNQSSLANLKFKSPPVSMSFSKLNHFSSALSEAMLQDGLLAIDISHHQGDLNWDTISKLKDPKKIEMIIMKASEGTSFVDKRFKTNWIKAKEYGFIRGAYHFYRPDAEPHTQAQNFIAQLGDLSKGDVIPVIDLEKPCANCSDLMGPHFYYMSDLKTFVDDIKKHYKTKVLFYSGNNYYYDYIKGYFPDDYFWIARYSVDNKPHDFGQQTIGWQFTDKMRLPGIKTSVDTNYFLRSYLEAIRKK